MKKRQEDILKKFQDKRLGYMKSQQSAETPPLLRSSSSFKETGEDEGEIECSLCKETLDSDHFYGNPYGQFAYVSNSKLLYHAYRQTLSDTSRSLSVKSESPQEQEEEKKASEMSMMDLV